MSARPTGWVVLALALVLRLDGCGGDAAPDGPTLRLWHTFGPEETRALNQTLATLARTQHLRVEPTVVPFGLARSRLAHTLTEASAPSAGCPDVARVDATWLPFLAARGLLTPVPASFELSGFTAEARELGRWDGVDVAVPQAVDGLALLYDARRVPGATGVAWPPVSLAQLETAARALTSSGRYGLSLRSDGYWFVAWLRAAGADVVDPSTGALGIDRPAAEAALGAYAALAAPGGVAPPPSPAGDEAALEAERFAAGEVAIIVGGPWTIAALTEAARRRGVEIELAVAPFPRAPDGTAASPRGGQLYVVPRCALHAEAAWRLIDALTDARLQADWSRTLGLIPTRSAALAEASPLARAFARALEATRPLPRHPLTPLVFDDLTPALQAVMAGDATAAEALAGVERAWTRLLARANASANAKAPTP